MLLMLLILFVLKDDDDTIFISHSMPLKLIQPESCSNKKIFITFTPKKVIDSEIMSLDFEISTIVVIFTMVFGEAR